MPSFPFVAESAPNAASQCTNHLNIRGRKLAWAELVHPCLFDDQHLQKLRDKMAAAQPFPHLVIDNLFHPDLLELVHEEFDLPQRETLQSLSTRHEKTFRSAPGAALGPACQLYFGIVNSGWFIDALARVAATTELIADAALHGGGLHETRQGGSFNIHRDFDRHLIHGLQQELVLITYLNAGWDTAAWGGQLELWDPAKQRATQSIAPLAGRTVLMRHCKHSYHGHPDKLSPPAGRTRRSVAAYYYTNPEARWMRARRVGTSFYRQGSADRLKAAAQFMLPPAVWYLLRLLRN